MPGRSRVLVAEEEVCPRCMQTLPPGSACVCGFTASVAELRERGAGFADDFSPLVPSGIWMRDIPGYWSILAWPRTVEAVAATVVMVLWAAAWVSAGTFFGRLMAVAGCALLGRVVFAFTYVRVKGGELRVCEGLPGLLRPEVRRVDEILGVRLWARKYSDGGQELSLLLDAIEIGHWLRDDQRDFLQAQLLRHIVVR